MIILSWKKRSSVTDLAKGCTNLNERFSFPDYQSKQVFLNGICFVEERKLDRGWKKGYVLNLQSPLCLHTKWRQDASTTRLYWCVLALLRCKWPHRVQARGLKTARRMHRNWSSNEITSSFGKEKNNNRTSLIFKLKLLEANLDYD